MGGIGACCCAIAKYLKSVKFSQYIGRPSYEAFDDIRVSTARNNNFHPERNSNSKFHDNYSRFSGPLFNFGYSVQGDSERIYVAAGERGVITDEKIIGGDGLLGSAHRTPAGNSSVRTASDENEYDINGEWTSPSSENKVWVGDQYGSRYGYEKEKGFVGVYDVCPGGTLSSHVPGTTPTATPTGNWVNRRKYLYIAHGLRGIYRQWADNENQSPREMTQVYPNNGSDYVDSIYKHIVKVDQFLFIGTQGYTSPPKPSTGSINAWVDYSDDYESGVGYPDNVTAEGVQVFRIEDDHSITSLGLLHDFVGDEITTGVNSIKVAGSFINGIELLVAYGSKTRGSSSETYSGGVYKYTLSFTTNNSGVREYEVDSLDTISNEPALSYDTDSEDRDYYSIGQSYTAAEPNGVTERIRGRYSRNTSNLSWGYFYGDAGSSIFQGQEFMMQRVRYIGESSMANPPAFYITSNGDNRYVNLEHEPNYLWDDAGGAFPTDLIAVGEDAIIVALWQRGLTVLDLSVNTLPEMGSTGSSKPSQKFYGLLNLDNIEGFDTSYPWDDSEAIFAQWGNSNHPYSLSIIDLHYDGAIYALDSLQYTANGGGPGYWSPCADELYSPPVIDGYEIHGGLAVLSHGSCTPPTCTSTPAI